MPRFDLVSLQEARLKSGTAADYIREYVDYIQRLSEGQAGRLVAGEGEKVGTIRRRLNTAAKLVDKKLVIRRQGNEVYFWEQPREERLVRRRGRRRKTVEQPPERPAGNGI